MCVFLRKSCKFSHTPAPSTHIHMILHQILSQSLLSIALIYLLGTPHSIVHLIWRLRLMYLYHFANPDVHERQDWRLHYMLAVYPGRHHKSAPPTNHWSLTHGCSQNSTDDQRPWWGVLGFNQSSPFFPVTSTWKNLGVWFLKLI